MKLFVRLFPQDRLDREPCYVVEDENQEIWHVDLDVSKRTTKVILSRNTTSCRPYTDYIYQEVCGIKKSIYGVYYCEWRYIYNYKKSNTDYIRRHHPDFFRLYR